MLHLIRRRGWQGGSRRAGNSGAAEDFVKHAHGRGGRGRRRWWQGSRPARRGHRDVDEAAHASDGVARCAHTRHVLPVNQQVLGARGREDHVARLDAGREVAHEVDVKLHVRELLRQHLRARQAAGRGSGVSQQ